MHTKTYHPPAGQHLVTACFRAARQAKRERCRVRFNFNAARLEATPKKSPSTLVWEWEQLTGRQHARWSASPAGRAAARERTEEIVARQLICDGIVENLPTQIGSLDSVMGSLFRLALNADDIGVKLNHPRIVRTLADAGFKENDHVGQPPEFFDDRPKLGYWIVGQVINCLNLGRPPHPMTAHFVGKYFALPPLS